MNAFEITCRPIGLRFSLQETFCVSRTGPTLRKTTAFAWTYGNSMEWSPRGM